MSQWTDNIPKDWKIEKFSNIAELRHGYQFRHYDFIDEGLKIFKITQIKGDGIADISACSYIDTNRLTHFSKFIINKGDILIALTGATIGKIARYNNDEIVLQNYRVGNFFSIDDSILSKEYLYQFLRTNYFYNQIISGQTQSAQQNIGKEDINNMLVILPPLSEQIAIASILSALDDKIELNLQQNKTLEEMAMALYKHWFVDFGPFQNGEFVESELGLIPSGWEVKRLGDICTVINGRAYKNEEFLEDGTPIIRIQNLSGGGKTVYSNLELSNDKYVDSGDLIYAWSATFGPYIWHGPKSIYHYHIWKLVVDTDLISKYYLFHHLDRTSSQMKEHGTGSIFTHLTKSTMEAQKVVIPAKEIIVEYNKLSSIYFKQILKNKDENQTLTTLRDTLLPKLISGEVRVKEAQQILSSVL